MSKRKVKLPVDRNGTPVDVGDFIAFSDGCFEIKYLTYYGDGVWDANTVEDAPIENIGNGEVVWRKGGVRS